LLDSGQQALLAASQIANVCSILFLLEGPEEGVIVWGGTRGWLLCSYEERLILGSDIIDLLRKVVQT